MKRVIRFLCVFMAFMLFLPSVSRAAEIRKDSTISWEGALQPDEFEWQLGEGVLLLKEIQPEKQWANHGKWIKEHGVLIADSQNLKGDIVIPEEIAGLPVLGLYCSTGPSSGVTGIFRFCLSKNPSLTSLTLPTTAKYLVSDQGFDFFGGEKMTKVYGLSQLAGLTDDTFLSCSALNPFEDTYDHWGESAIKWSYDEGLFKGVGLTKFSPNGKVTRGMITSVLYRWEGSPAVSDGTPFPDVRTGVYYTTPVKWAAENGIVSGYENGKFGPNDNVTREQLVAILYRYAKTKGASAVSCDLSTFTDCGKISSYAREAMEWTVGTGIISGKGNGKLDPKGFATRAEAATVLKKFGELRSNS